MVELNPTTLVELADRIREEAALASRAGQMGRLSAIADALVSITTALSAPDEGERHWHWDEDEVGLFQCGYQERGESCPLPDRWTARPATPSVPTEDTAAKEGEQ